MPTVPTGLRALARSLQFLERRTEIISHNLANAETGGFKRLRIAAMLDAASGGPVGVASLDASMGALATTERPLDIALDGDVFLQVRTPAGAERLSRGGSLEVDGDGLLRTAGGDFVLDRAGNPLAVGREGALIGPEGSLETPDGIGLGALGLIRAPDGVTPEGARRFVADGAVEAVDGEVVHVGMLEDANVDPVSTMVDMVTTQRAYQAATAALRALDETSGLATGLSRVR